MIQAYKKLWKGYVDFSGVTSRRDYWLAVLANFIISFILALVSSIAGQAGSGSGPNILSALTSIYSLAVFLPALAIMVRRLRDAEQSWANIFWIFLPVAGAIILIVKLCKPTVAGDGVHAVSAEYTSGTPVYRTYQPQAKSPAVSAAPAGTAVSAPKSAYAPVKTTGGVKVPLSSLRPYHGNGVCDVCNRSLSGEAAYIVPNNVFYASPEYRKHYADMNAVFFSLSGQSAEQALRYMQAQDHSEGSAVCENCIHMFAEKEEDPYESRKQEKDTFYVFAAKGAAFGNVTGDIGAVIMEKAEKLRDGYEPAKNMELSVIDPQEWGGMIKVSNQNGVISSSISLADHKESIRSYLEKAGVESSLIDAGIAETEKESLILSNPFSGVTVIGIPIVSEKPAAATAAGKPDQASVTAKEIEQEDNDLPTHLLVRFDIDKLNALGGAYGFSAGKLLGSAVPEALMEMMIISDGDSAATLSGTEQVYLIDISASGSSPEILRDRIMPLIQQNGELMKYTAQPPVQLCHDTAAEPLVICGVVRKAQISGAGGLCASGLTNAWKDNKSKNNFCMNCGAKLPENADLCPQCGTKVPDSW